MVLGTYTIKAVKQIILSIPSGYSTIMLWLKYNNIF